MLAMNLPILPRSFFKGNPLPPNGGTFCDRIAPLCLNSPGLRRQLSGLRQRHLWVLTQPHFPRCAVQRVLIYP